jgi:hypothetical protein
MEAPSFSRPYSGFLFRLPQLARNLLLRLRPRAGTQRYRPEKHYMRGPGPKSGVRGADGRLGKGGDRNSSAA